MMVRPSPRAWSGMTTTVTTEIPMNSDVQRSNRTGEIPSLEDWDNGELPLVLRNHQQTVHDALPDARQIVVVNLGQLIRLAKNIEVTNLAAHFIARRYGKHGLDGQYVVQSGRQIRPRRRIELLVFKGHATVPEHADPFWIAAVEDFR